MGSKFFRRAGWIALTSLLSAFFVTACETADPNTSAYWIEKLQTEERRSAIQWLGDNKAKDAVPALMEAYKEKRHRPQIVTSLVQINDQAAIPTMLEALKDTAEAKAGQLAASALLDWEAYDHYDVFIPVLTDKATPRETAYGVLQLVAKKPDARAIPILLEILKGNPDLQPIAFNGLAAEALGKLAEEKAIPGLIDCLWLDDHVRRNEVPACRMALNRIGPKVVPALIQALERKNRSVEARARKFKYNVGGIIEAKAAEIIGDFLAKDAVEPLLTALATKEQMPSEYQIKPELQQTFVLSDVQKVISIAKTLAAIGDDRAVAPLVEIASSKELPLEKKLAAVEQLAFLGSQKAIPGLLKVLEVEPHPRDSVSQGFRLKVALSLANLIDRPSKDADKVEAKIKAIRDQMPKYAESSKAEIAKAKAKVEAQEKLVASLKDPTDDAGRAKLKAAQDDLKGWQNTVLIYESEEKAYAEWGKEYNNLIAKFDLLRECGRDAACNGKALMGTDEPKRVAAAYRLAQMTDNAAAARAELIKAAGCEDMVLRSVVFFGLDRVGDKSNVAAIEEVLKADTEKAKEKKEFQGALYLDELMIAKLSHR